SEDDITAHISPKMMRTIFPQLQGLINSGGVPAGFLRNLARGEGGNDDFVKGMVTEAAGIEWFRTQNCGNFTTGTQGGTPVVAGANQTGSSITSSGWT